MNYKINLNEKCVILKTINIIISQFSPHQITEDMETEVHFPKEYKINKIERKISPESSASPSCPRNEFTQTLVKSLLQCCQKII